MCDIKASLFSFPKKDIVMLFLEHYQSTPDHRGNNMLDPFHFGNSLNKRWRLSFFRRAERFLCRSSFIYVRCEVRRDGLLTYTFQSRVNGCKFTLVRRDERFIFLHVHGRYNPVIRNYFGFLACMLQESGIGCSAELMRFDC